MIVTINEPLSRRSKAVVTICVILGDFQIREALYFWKNPDMYIKNMSIKICQYK